MRHMRRGATASLAAVSVVVWLALPLVPAGAAGKQTGHGKGDTFELAQDVHAKINKKGAAVANADATHAPEVGDVRTWLGLDDAEGFYPKNYVLRGVGDHVEVWVATGTATFAGITSTDLNFADDDCRNGVRTTVTDAQVDYLIGQFDNNILPTESEKYSTAPDRNGFKSTASKVFHLSSNYYRGDGDNTVVLVDNFRDDNFKDTDNVNNFSYIAGFFSSGLNGFFNRNIMSIDGFDWLHRTGEDPPNQPVPGDNCASAPARPFLYEGVFAHEYNHLLRSYVDPAETTWQNEGTADTAIVLTGYSNPKAPITDILQQLSYSASFLDVAVRAAEARGIRSAFWALGQYDFAYDPARLDTPVAPDPVFIGTFPWSDAEDAEPLYGLFCQQAHRERGKKSPPSESL